jgi:large subunit ribosomal protein L17
MRHLVAFRKLGRTSTHRKALLRNLATSLILQERIETTLPKAKELRRLADRLIGLGKEGTLHARRQAAAVLQEPQAVKKLFDGLAARFKERAGGYTRIFKFGFRPGDGADMAAIEYLGYEPPVKSKKEEKKTEKKVQKKLKVEKKTEKKTEEKKEKPKKAKWSLFGRKEKKD